jgi:hypothetical protein
MWHAMERSRSLETAAAELGDKFDALPSDHSHRPTLARMIAQLIAEASIRQAKRLRASN